MQLQGKNSQIELNLEMSPQKNCYMLYDNNGLLVDLCTYIKLNHLYLYVMYWRPKLTDLYDIFDFLGLERFNSITKVQSLMYL